MIGRCHWKALNLVEDVHKNNAPRKDNTAKFSAFLIKEKMIVPAIKIEAGSKGEAIHLPNNFLN